MEEKSTATLEKIQRAAMEEFSEKGFQGASLRQIVKQAGVTTGALYGYFSSKEALFASIVEPHAAALMGRFMEAQTAFAEMPEQEQPEHMGLESSQCVHWMVDYICDHREPVKLLLCKARGHHTRSRVRPQYGGGRSGIHPPIPGGSAPSGHECPQLDAQLCHIIASGMFNGIFEIVVHDMPKEQAMRYVDQLWDFYTAGWLKLIGQ